MERASKNEHNHIKYFNPDVMSLEQAYQDYFIEIKKFNAGKGYENFNDFLVEKEAITYKDEGNGVTYIALNIKRGTNEL